MTQKILIGLIEHFGDIVACEPVPRYLRQKYPDSHIAWAIQAPYRELVDGNPNVDETIVLGCLTDWIKLYKHNKNKYNLIVDLHVNYRVCQDCRVSLIKETGNPFVNAYEWFDHGALLEAFCLGAGLPKLSAQPLVYIEEKHRRAVDLLGLEPGYCVIHRESNLAAKDWPEDKWHALVRFLVQDLKIPVVEVGASKNIHIRDNAYNVSASGAWGSRMTSLLNRTTLLETAEVIRRARFFVGIDSGPAHLANAVKTPGVVLLGRLGYFRQYTPFTGFYAGAEPEVRLVRNLTGVTAEVPVQEVIEAVRYLTHIPDKRDNATRTPKEIAQRAATPLPLSSDDRNRVVESDLFDRAWYVTHHPEVTSTGMDALDHFLTVGANAGYSPGEGFDAAWYTSQRPDLVAVTDPLQHYLDQGRKEGLLPRPPRAPSVLETPPHPESMAKTLVDLYHPVETCSTSPDEVLPRIFAFYLPQFHPIAENNYGHRSGFTEWDNIIKAKPLFKGHYQPRVPGELGYYDLRSVDVMREQVQLANDHGITGFCFYYYYFHGKKLLYKPIENYIKSDIHAPFFFVWANENWTRRWDGGDNEVLVSQGHSREDDLAFIRELLPVFSDNRYVKIEGKPILAIYKTHLFPEIERSTELWRTEATQYGFPGLYLVMVDDWSADPPHPRELGFDASYEIPSNIVPEGVLLRDHEHLGLTNGFEGRVVDYRKFASFHMGRPFPDYKRFRTVMAPWDNTPRYNSRAMVHVNTENDAYRLWLTEALIDTKRRYAPDERLVFLHSWNEWCEGTYLEPDGRYGRHLLEETRAAVEELSNIENNGGDGKVAAYLFRLMREKDEGASRSLQAMRQQNMYVYREVEHQREQLTILKQQAAKQELEQAEHRAAIRAAEQALRSAEQILQGVLRSKSWRVTLPLRALARLLHRP